MDDRKLDKGREIGETARKASEALAAFQAIIDEVVANRLWGEFGVTFDAQEGLAIRRIELRKITRK